MRNSSDLPAPVVPATSACGPSRTRSTTTGAPPGPSPRHARRPSPCAGRRAAQPVATATGSGAGRSGRSANATRAGTGGAATGPPPGRPAAPAGGVCACRCGPIPASRRAWLSAHRTETACNGTVRRTPDGRSSVATGHPVRTSRTVRHQDGTLARSGSISSSAGPDPPAHRRAGVATCLSRAGVSTTTSRSADRPASGSISASQRHHAQSPRRSGGARTSTTVRAPPLAPGSGQSAAAATAAATTARAAPSARGRGPTTARHPSGANASRPVQDRGPTGPGGDAQVPSRSAAVLRSAGEASSGSSVPARPPAVRRGRSRRLRRSAAAARSAGHSHSTGPSRANASSSRFPVLIASTSEPIAGPNQVAAPGPPGLRGRWSTRAPRAAAAALGPIGSPTPAADRRSCSTVDPIVSRSPARNRMGRPGRGPPSRPRGSRRGLLLPPRRRTRSTVVPLLEPRSRATGPDRPRPSARC